MLIPPPHLQLAPEEKLVYRGEGNSSLVIALKSERKVIRLLKADAKQLKRLDDDAQKDLLLPSSSPVFETREEPKGDSQREADLLRVLQSHIRFNDQVIPRILSRAFYSAPQLVRLNQSQTNRINQLVRDKRPRFRLDKSISHGETYALLLPDYCCLSAPPLRPSLANQTCGPVIAVEIKPKQGFLPDLSVLSESLKIKAHVCRYCLSQFHKLKKGSVLETSAYCPLDLFSGCPHRMLCALLALVDCPQNNFRVFRDIQYAYGEEADTPLSHVIHDFVAGEDKDKCRLFCGLLVQALTLPLDSRGEAKRRAREHAAQHCSLHNNQCKEEREGEGERSQRLETRDRGIREESTPRLSYSDSSADQSHCCRHQLPSGSVLETILSAQKLDSIDSSLANEMLAFVLNNNNSRHSETITELQMQSLFGDTLDRSATPASCPPSSEPISGESNRLEYCSRKVWQFLVSLTAKDCSIMIAMQRLANESSHVSHQWPIIVEPNSGHKYLVSIRVTDLDQKSPQKIKRTLSNDLRMISAFEDSCLL